MPGSGLTAVGTLSYNGYTFNGASVVKVRAEYVRDEARRTVIHTKYTITVFTTIVPDTNSSATDNSMAEIHRKLSKDGGVLVFRNRGFGAGVSINAANARDVKWGPKPQILEWESVGSSAACNVTWSVEVCILECLDAKYSGVMAMNYDIEFDLDRFGDTTRTIRGYLEIAQTWQNNANVGAVRYPPDSADRYREQISPRPPKRFHRVRQSWACSKDRSRIEFTIVDQQIPSRNAPAKFMVDSQGTHSVRWALNDAGRQYSTISVTLAPDARVSPVEAWLVFLTILNNRGKIAENQERQPFLIAFEVIEEIWGRPCGFTAVYYTVGTPQDMLSTSGLWTPLGTDWNQWQQSIESTVFNQRGNALLFHDPSQDAIIDLCGSSRSSEESLSAEPKPPTKTFSKLANKKPKPQRSYMLYRARIYAKRRQWHTRHTPSQAHQGILSPSENVPKPTSESGFSFPETPSGAATDVIQLRANPSYDIVFEGEALRAGYPIPRPELLTVGGKRAIESEGDFVMAVVGDGLGVPVYGANWSIHYVLDGSPGAVSPPDLYGGELISGKTGAIS